MAPKEIIRINENDVLIIISYPRYSRTTIDAAKFVKERKTKIVAITDTEESPAYALADEEKREQELMSLKKVDDSFRKIIIVGDDIATYTDDNGYVFMSLFRFLVNDDVLE